MKKYDLGNGHALLVEKANRGLEDDYKVAFTEDGKSFGSEYYTRDAIEFEFDIKVA